LRRRGAAGGGSCRAVGLVSAAERAFARVFRTALRSIGTDLRPEQANGAECTEMTPYFVNPIDIISAAR